MPETTTFYLEMLSPEQLRATPQPAELRVAEAQIKQYEVNRFLYDVVGREWGWEDRLAQTDDEWKAYAQRKELRTWIAHHKGSIAGYYELEAQSKGSVEIKYFGLLPRFIGMGFGGYLLTHAIQSAWRWGSAKRVWVHTCTLDHEGALANYQARGFSIFKRVVS